MKYDTAIRILEFKVKPVKDAPTILLSKPNSMKQSLKEIFVSVHDSEDGLDKFMSDINFKRNNNDKQ